MVSICLCEYLLNTISLCMLCHKYRNYLFILHMKWKEILIVLKPWNCWHVYDSKMNVSFVTCMLSLFVTRCFVFALLVNSALLWNCEIAELCSWHKGQEMFKSMYVYMYEVMIHPIYYYSYFITVQFYDVFRPMHLAPRLCPPLSNVGR